MAIVALTSGALFLADSQLDPITGQVALETKVDVVDVTTLGSAGYRQQVAGLAESKIDVSGFGDFNPSGFETNLAAMPVTGAPFSVAPNGGTAVGDVAFLTRVNQGQFVPLAGKVGDAPRVQVMAVGDQRVVRGQVAHPFAARTANGNGGAVTLAGPSSTQRLWAAFHCTTFSGSATPTLTVKVQSATDNVFTTPVDRITFTTLSNATGSQFASTAVGAYTATHHRVTWTVTGTTPSFSFFAVVGVA